MRAYKRMAGIFAVIMVLSAAVLMVPAVSAAEKKMFTVRFEKEAAPDSITLTAVLKDQDPEAYANVFLAALEYDSSALSITEEDIKVLSGGMSFRTAVDAEKGIASVECGYIEQFPEPGDALVSFRFTVLEGTDVSKLNTDSIKLCGDNDYLASLSDNYSGTGGFMLSNGFDSYSAKDGQAEVTFDLPQAPVQNGGCSSSRDAAVIGAAVFLAAAALTVVRSRMY